ncbi:gamma-glutamyltransferase [Candidatus Zixiibacteriota bacterium]
MNKQKNTLFLIALAIPVILATSLLVARERQPQEVRPTTLAGRSSVIAPHGMIATSQPLATAAGLHVLQNGGNAVDAAVTAAAVLCLVEPHMTGIGGDVFAIYWSAGEQRLTGLNASGRSGSLMTREELVNRGFERVPGSGLEAVTVPGAISGWAALLERFGTITLAEALQPVIKLAEEGFPVSPIIAGQWANQTRKLLRDEGSKNTWLIDGERSPREGEMFSNPDLAASFRLIADQGPAAFYGGELGEKIVAFMEENGGFLTLQDLRDHRIEWVEPVGASLGNYTLWELPPNGQGIAALEMLRILEPYELQEMGHNSAKYLHHLIEAKKLAFADLARYVGDPDHLDVSPEHLISDSFIEARRALLNPNQAARRQDPGPAVTSTETIYLTVADAEGNMISFINSVFDYFGSGITVPGTGFTLQNRGQGFTMEEGLPNTVAPRKRPFHTLIPAFVTRSEDGSDHDEPWLAFGVMGGSMQPQGHIQVLLNMLLFGMDPQEAIDAPRFRHLSGLRVVLESPIGDEVRQALEAMGHVIGAEASVAFGGAQAIMRLAEGWSAGSDPRKDGMAAGY